jgi:hypothetical protein
MKGIGPPIWDRTWINVLSFGVGVLAIVSGVAAAATGSVAGGLYTLAFGVVVAALSLRKVADFRRPRKPTSPERLPGESQAFFGAAAFSVVGIVILALGISAAAAGNLFKGILGIAGGLGGLVFGGLGVVGITMARRRRSSREDGN